MCVTAAKLRITESMEEVRSENLNLDGVKYSKPTIFIAKAYILLLTVRMISPLAFISGLLHGAGVYFDVVLHVLGPFAYPYRYARQNNYKKRP